MSRSFGYPFSETGVALTVSKFQSECLHRIYPLDANSTANQVFLYTSIDSSNLNTPLLLSNPSTP